MPCSSCQALFGEAADPRSRSSCTRAFVMYAMSSPSAPVKLTPWYDGSGSVSPGNRSVFSDHLNVPPSTMAPTTTVPWPDRNFVAEWVTMSAPCSNGRIRYGVAIVLSAISGRPFSCAMSAMPWMSSTFACGLPMVSAKNSFVLGRTARRHSSRSSWFSMNVVSMPSFASVYLNRLNVPP